MLVSYHPRCPTDLGPITVHTRHTHTAGSTAMLASSCSLADWQLLARPPACLNKPHPATTLSGDQGLDRLVDGYLVRVRVRVRIRVRIRVRVRVRVGTIWS